MSKHVTFIYNDKEIKVCISKKIELDNLKNTIAGFAGGTDFEIWNKKGDQMLGLTTLYLAKDEDQPLTTISKASGVKYHDGVFLTSGFFYFSVVLAKLYYRSIKDFEWR